MGAHSTPLVLAIAGGTGAGKTTIVRALTKRIGTSEVVVLDQDSYYKGQTQILEPVDADNFDHPARIDHDLLLEQLDALMRGQPIQKPRYDFATHSRLAQTDYIQGAKTIVIEGLFAYWDLRIRSRSHCNIFVDAGADLRLIRRLQRDLKERSRTMEGILEQYLNTVRPMHTKHIEPLKELADVIIRNEETIETGIDELLSFLRRNSTKSGEAFISRGTGS